MEEFPVGEPIIASKCDYMAEHGLIVAGKNGFAWRPKLGKHNRKWVRWGDVANVIPANPKYGIIQVQMYKRDKKGNLIIKKGNPIMTSKRKMKLTARINNGEDKAYYKKRRYDFPRLMMELHEKYKPAEIPATSDSRY